MGLELAISRSRVKHFSDWVSQEQLPRIIFRKVFKIYIYSVRVLPALVHLGKVLQPHPPPQWYLTMYPSFFCVCSPGALTLLVFRISSPLLSSLSVPTRLGFKPPRGPGDTMQSLGALTSEELQPSLQMKGIVIVLVFSFFLPSSFSFYFKIISNLQESLKNSAGKSHIVFTWIHQFETLCYIYFYPPTYLPTMYFLRIIWE